MLPGPIARTARNDAMLALARALVSGAGALSPHDLVALSDLIQALLLLDDGLVAPMLAARRFANRPPDSAWQRALKADLVASCIALEGAGLSGADARRAVARSCKLLRLRAAAERAIEPTTLYSWWKKLRSDPLVQRLALVLVWKDSAPAAVIRKIEATLGSYVETKPRRAARVAAELKLAS
jgi:hypothetical protein